MNSGQKSLEDYFQTPNEFKAGFEKETLFQAFDKEDQTILNLNIAGEVLKRKGEIVEGDWDLVEEYSENLIEVVSPPTEISGLERTLQKLASIEDSLDEHVRESVQEHSAELLDHYTLKTTQEGTSKSDLYLTLDGRILNDKEHNKEIIRPYCHHFLDLEGDVTVKVGELEETSIGIYNHLNSFNVTLSPTYTGDAEYDYTKYLHFLKFVEDKVQEYKQFDEGNKEIIRDGVSYTSEQNVRDLFLEEMTRAVNPQGINNTLQFNSSEDLKSEFEEQVEVLMKAYGNNVTLDEAFKKWSVTHLRPRLINDALFAVEVKGFGSNFSYEKMQEFVEEVHSFDRKYDNGLI